MSRLNELEAARIDETEPWRNGKGITVGTYLEVEHRASLSDPIERVVGLVLAKQRKVLASSFDLLCQIDGVPVEYKFQLYSPLLLSIEERGALPKKRKGPLYFYRSEMKSLSFPAPRDTETRARKVGGAKKKKKK